MESILQIFVRECGGKVLNSSPITLPQDELHIWHWEPARTQQELSDLWKVLSEDEQERAERYRFPKHRDEFVINRARLRSLLAGYLARLPRELVFDYAPHGKPYLRNESGDWRFNLSHTEGRAAFAITRAREVGIDIEQMRPQADARKIAERFFSVKERQSLHGLSREALDRAFFRCWTRKEAYIKARGEGLSIPLHQFDVSLAEGEPAALLGTRPDPNEAQRWILYDLPFPKGYAGAVAIAATRDQATSAHAVPVDRASLAERD
jgi:4'-phosphopantetheinyl transferase